MRRPVGIAAAYMVDLLGPGWANSATAAAGAVDTLAQQLRHASSVDTPTHHHGGPMRPADTGPRLPAITPREQPADVEVEITVRVTDGGPIGDHHRLTFRAERCRGGDPTVTAQMVRVAAREATARAVDMVARAYPEQ